MENNSITYHSAVVFVKDIEAAKKFYIDVLGMKIANDFGMDVILEGGLTLFQVFPEQVIAQMLGMETLHDHKATRFELCFETTDIESVSKKIVNSGVDLLHPLQEEPWGQKTVRFFDPDHHLIEIGESLETFAKRNAATGMTPEQVSQKTGTPLEDVLRFLAK